MSGCGDRSSPVLRYVAPSLIDYRDVLQVESALCAEVREEELLVDDV